MRRAAAEPKRKSRVYRKHRPQRDFSSDSKSVAHRVTLFFRVRKLRQLRHLVGNAYGCPTFSLPCRARRGIPRLLQRCLLARSSDRGNELGSQAPFRGSARGLCSRRYRARQVFRLTNQARKLRDADARARTRRSRGEVCIVFRAGRLVPRSSPHAADIPLICDRATIRSYNRATVRVEGVAWADTPSQTLGRRVWHAAPEVLPAGSRMEWSVPTQRVLPGEVPSAHLSCKPREIEAWGEVPLKERACR